MAEFIASLATIVALVAQAVGIIINISNSNRNSKKDTSEESKQMGQLLTDLKYIRGSVDNIQTKLDKQEDKNLSFERRIFEDAAGIEKLEMRVNTLNDAVDKIEGRVARLEEKVNEGSLG